MKRTKQREEVYARILGQHLDWYRRARAIYEDAGFKRRDLDDDALVLLMVEIAEMIWRRDLKIDAVTSMIGEMVADIKQKHPDILQ